ncbi:MAG: hypothetical protein WA951_03460, partial [Leeuwenhoekiella sp.]
FILDDSNDFTIKLQSQNNELHEVEIQQASSGFGYTFFFLIIGIFFCISLYNYHFSKNKTSI